MTIFASFPHGGKDLGLTGAKGAGAAGGLSAELETGTTLPPTQCA